MVCGLAFVLCQLSSTGSAHERPALEHNGSIHWAYASFLGTCYYQVSEDPTVWVVDGSPSWSVQAPDPAASGWNRLGISIDTAVTLGVHQLDSVDDLLDIDNCMLSLVPGVTITLPVNDRWRLAAYGHLGRGTETSSEDQAWIYDFGVKGDFAFQHGNLDWSVFNGLF
ncbi:MAG: hypothetical protein AAGH65_01000 [Pseudomonadota bacterium]